MRIIGILLLIAGCGLAIWSAVVGLSFAGIFVVGFVGTSGNEYGRELTGMLLLTGIGTVSGYIIAKIGKALTQKKKRNT